MSKNNSTRNTDYRVTFKDSGKRITGNEVKEIRDIMTDIIARSIANTRK